MVQLAFALAVVVASIQTADSALVRTVRNDCEYAPNAPVLACAPQFVPDKFCSSNKYCVALRCVSDMWWLGAAPMTFGPLAPEDSAEFTMPFELWHYYVVNAGIQSDKVGCLCDGAIRFRFFEINYADYQAAVAMCSGLMWTRDVIPVGTPVPQYIDPANVGKYFYRNDGIGMFKVLGVPGGGAADQFAFFWTTVTGSDGTVYTLKNELGSAPLVDMVQLFGMIARQVGLPFACHSPLQLLTPTYFNVEWSSVGLCSSGPMRSKPLMKDVVTPLPRVYVLNPGTFLTVTPPDASLQPGAVCLDGRSPCAPNGTWPGYCYFGQCTPLTAGSYCTFPDECESNTCSANVCA